jgi:hypothetical protein
LIEKYNEICNNCGDYLNNRCPTCPVEIARQEYVVKVMKESLKNKSSSLQTLINVI